MSLRIILTGLCILFLCHQRLSAQKGDSAFYLSAVVYDDIYAPVPATHVININTRQGDVSDSLGIFRIYVDPGDTLLFRNIAFRDTLISVRQVDMWKSVKLKRRRYELEEARVFEWGATYDDFKEAFIEMPIQQTLGASMGLPQQDPDKVPLEMDEKAIKSAGLLLTSPVSFFYYNFSKHAKSERKVYWLKKNQAKHEQFDAIVSTENLSDVTGLFGTELQEFRAFLFQRMVCDMHCTDLEIYNEIHGLWKVYQELEERGMLNGGGQKKGE